MGLSLAAAAVSLAVVVSPPEEGLLGVVSLGVVRMAADAEVEVISFFASTEF